MFKNPEKKIPDWVADAAERARSEELERQRSETERARSEELERQRSEEEMIQAEMEKHQREADAGKKREEEMNQAEMERERREADARKKELERKKREEEIIQAEMERERRKAEQWTVTPMSPLQPPELPQPPLTIREMALDGDKAETVPYGFVVGGNIGVTPPSSSSSIITRHPTRSLEEFRKAPEFRGDRVKVELTEEEARGLLSSARSQSLSIGFLQFKSIIGGPCRKS